ARRPGPGRAAAPRNLAGPRTLGGPNSPGSLDNPADPNSQGNPAGPGNHAGRSYSGRGTPADPGSLVSAESVTRALAGPDIRVCASSLLRFRGESRPADRTEPVAGIPAPDTAGRAEQLAALLQLDQAMIPHSPAAAGTVTACRDRAQARRVPCGRPIDAWIPS